MGQVHFLFHGKIAALKSFFNAKKQDLIDSTAPLTANMKKRGGGIIDIELKDKTDLIESYHQLHLTFDTVDSMGANFINSCLEQVAKTLQSLAENDEVFLKEQHPIEVIMSILSNFVPQCLVQAEVRCPVEQLKTSGGMSGMAFAQKFIQAVEIAQKEPYRAVTHNKGIMNGVDAVVIATGNDFRAVEAGVHALCCQKWKLFQFKSCFFGRNRICLSTKTTPIPWHSWRANPIASYGQMVYGIARKAQCQKFDGNHCSSGLGTKLCRC